MALISFAYPNYLIFLILIPLVILIHFVTLKSAKSTALKFANFEAIARIKGVDFLSRNIIILFISILLVLLLALSLAGLRWHTVRDASSYSFVLALDSSQSMEANDLSPNRMEAAKKAALEFVESTPLTTRAGVISFSGNSLIEQGMTESKALMKTAIQNIQISDISGTDIYEAIITGTNLLKGEESGAIILLSDGQINVGSIEDTIKYANDNEVVVHTIAVGTEEGGVTSYGVSKVDEDSLRALSYNTKGIFSWANNEEQLSAAFNNAMEKTKKKVAIELSDYLLIASLVLFVIEYWLVSTRYRRLI